MPSIPLVKDQTYKVGTRNPSQNMEDEMRLRPYVKFKVALRRRLQLRPLKGGDYFLSGVNQGQRLS